LSNPLKQQEAKMTFHFHNLPFLGTSAFLSEQCGRCNPPRRRLSLIARWQHGAEGRLECRWERQSGNFLPD
jgi:hypothetical protein